jgi:hypothetical protein
VISLILQGRLKLRGKNFYSGVGLCEMVIWNLNQFFQGRRFFAMDMAVRLMVIDAQDIIAVRKRAFPAVSRSL